MRKHILSMGEALVDVLPAGDELWRPVSGGSSYNVALALGRLGAPAAFVGRLSRDEQGRRMAAALEAAGVATDLVSRDDRPSPLSLVERGSEARNARYSIHLADTAHAPPDLPEDWLAGAAHLHVSSFSAVVGAWGAAVASALDAAKGRATRSIDINIRPGLLPTREKTRLLVEERLAQVEIVKASDEDLLWLFPDDDPLDMAARWSTRGPIAILTRGGDGASLFARGRAIHHPGFAVSVVDTVGAGDTFMAAFLSRAAESDVLGRLPDIGAEQIRALFGFANAAAALCCARPGADAPTRGQVEAFLERPRSS